MYPYFHIILPSYSLLAFIGGFFSLIFIYLRLEKFDIDFDIFLKMFIFCIIGGFIGSKVLFVITHVSWLVENFTLYNLIILFLKSGYVYYGGLFGVLISIIMCTKDNLYIRKRIFRMIAPAIPLFHCFGRIGCFLAGCCYGISLKVNINLFGFLLLDKLPVQLIESLFEFIMFIILLIFINRNNMIDGVTEYLIAYGVFRFMIEFFRGDSIRGIFCGLSTSQWISAIIVIEIVYSIFKSKRTFNLNV